MENKTGCGCGCSTVPETEPVNAQSKEQLKENWYLPYMNKKTQGEAVEEKPSPVAVFYCAGASNVGQASMLASVQAANKAGYDKAALLCLASIPAGLKNIYNGAKNARGIVAVDGCPMQCSMKTLRKYELEPDKNIIITKDLSIKKDFDLNAAQDLNKISDHIVQAVNKVYNSVPAE
ncbi:Uncharacterized protein, contains metal-binding DGC domain [Desulfoscipio geothermicus DSM 3669]|uniref:Uncharacterized protein, contains metal-binding DGC domain n=1 Tax=Desulfoscipio geothermicus DSM 3669 TaxID=1121426 RepID=A0A1I6E075_9FIRM|nr:Uncharacterized protein, contains metal-binding DGC domain [Desulfoscipio geothermicus DSM 3669]